jgi:hypothetical protein
MLTRPEVEAAAKTALDTFNHQRFLDYMSTYDSAPENWETATLESVQEDVLAGSIVFIWMNCLTSSSRPEPIIIDECQSLRGILNPASE